MLRLLLALIALACVSGANYKFMETSACEKVASESSCTSTSGCSWCKSGAVGASCMDSKDAAALPASVFTCEDAVKSTAAKVDATKDNYFFLKTSECEKVASESSCTDSSGCSWCKSGAVGASCMDASDAAALPSSVFICTDSKSLTSEKSGYKGFGIYPENDGTLSPSTASCLASSEYASFVVARGYRDGLSADTNGVTDFCPSLENAKTAGIPDRHVHMEPDSKGPKSAATQIGELKAALDGCSAFNGKIWLDVQNTVEWSPDRYTNRNWYTELVDACKSSGYSCGVFSNYQDWYTIFEYSGDPFSYGSELPLWYSTYGQSGGNLDPDFKDYVKPFGGWTSPSAKKFNQLPVCGIEKLSVDYAVRAM